MDYQLDIIELGNALKKVEESFGLKVLIKMELSGGWFTIDGKAYIKKYPEKKYLCSQGKGSTTYIILKMEELDIIWEALMVQKRYCMCFR